MLNRMTGQLARIIRNHHGRRPVAFGAALCDWYLRAYWNERHYDLGSNGEALLLDRLSRVHGQGAGVVALDVGANVGDYAEAVLRRMPQARVHCFEIVPSVHAELRARLGHEPAAVLNGFGLSDRDAEVAVSYYPDSRTESRIDALPRTMRTEVITGRIRRGDDYLAEQGIERVDLLKIDTEGHELSVLRGFGQALAQGRITVIQFEYGTTWLAARALLHDAYEALAPHGFAIGRLFPDGVLFRDYNPFRDEHFRMGNYVAVTRSRTDLIEAIAASA